MAIEKKNMIPIRIKQIEDRLKEKEMEFENEKKGLNDLKRQGRDIEREIQDLEVKINKSQQKLSQIKSNKEYTAALKEIDDLKFMKESTEDKALEIMESIEEKEKELAKMEKDLKAHREDCEKMKRDILKEAEELEREIVELKKERIECERSVEQELLDRYNFLMERRDGQAISPVIKGVCQTCHMGIPPQKFIELIKGESLMTCPNCNRIIYWGEDEQLTDII
jgi:hypothetical protein